MVRQCVVCQRVMRRQGDGPVLRHTICLNCLPPGAGYPVEDLSSMTAAQADLLPFGFIRLNGANHVVTYNEDESRRSHLAPRNVLGRDFFADVAPCTNVKEFAGWVQDQRMKRNNASVRFRFVFAFDAGSELVEVGLTYNAGRDETYVLVRSVAQDALPDLEETG